MSMSLPKTKKRPGALIMTIPLVKEEMIPSTVLEFAEYYFKKKAEMKMTPPAQIQILKDSFYNIYDQLMRNLNLNPNPCSDCIACNKTCMNLSNVRVLKYDEETIPYEFSIYSDDNTQGKQFVSVVKGKTVCKVKNTVVKKTGFATGEIGSEKTNFNYNITLFILIWEITIQNYVSDLCRTDEELRVLNVTVPKITNYYLNNIENEFMEITMTMDYVKTVPLSYTNYDRCIEILDRLKTTYNILHNDTHTENIRQTLSGQIVLFDWGKGSLGNGIPSTSGLYGQMTQEDFTNWLDASAQLKANNYAPGKTTDLYGGKLHTKNKKRTKNKKHTKKLKVKKARK